MNDVRFAPVDAVEREAATEPPTVWRNLFSCEQPISTQRNGDVGPGEFWGSGVYATKEVAEEQAREDMAREITYVLARGVRYLGAYPEGERPE